MASTFRNMGLHFGSLLWAMRGSRGLGSFVPLSPRSGCWRTSDLLDFSLEVLDFVYGMFEVSGEFSGELVANSGQFL